MPLARFLIMPMATFLQGRPCFGYERIDRWIIYPGAFHSELYNNGNNET